MKIKTLFIGADGEKTVNSATTQEQIEAVRALECTLEAENGEKISWKDVDNPQEPRSLFQFILGDRKIRVDQNTPMADRPAFAVITAIDNKAVRLEFYEGHDALELTYDLRAKELHKKDLPIFMKSDPNAYNPVEFLKEAFGFPEDLTKSLLDKIHE